MLVAAAVLAGCDSANEPTGGGGLALEIVSAGGGAAALDSGRVILSGPTPRTVSATPGGAVVINELEPGSYSLMLQGFLGDEVDHFGQTTGVQVVAGQTTTATVTFASFRPAPGPVTLTADGDNYLISFPAVAGADSYRIETDHDAAFPAPQVLKVTDPTGSFPIDIFGPLFVRVRAFDPLDGVGVLSDTRTVTLARVGSTAAIDGSVASDGDVSTAVGVMGDFDQSAGDGYSARQLFSFDLLGLPAGASVSSAVVRLFQATVDAGVYASHGNVIVDHVDIGDIWDGTAYADHTLQADIGTLSTDETIDHKALEVTTQVQADLAAARTRSQFRVLFETDSDHDATNDLVQFVDAETSCFYAPCPENDIPELRLVYEE